MPLSLCGFVLLFGVRSNTIVFSESNEMLLGSASSFSQCQDESFLGTDDAVRRSKKDLL